MAKGEPLSRYQKGIVNRYYEHKDTILSNRLSELVSDLYLAEGGAKLGTLWDRVGKALAQAGVDPQRAKAILDQRDVQALAALAGELAGGKPMSSSAVDAPAQAPASSPQASASASAEQSIDPETLKAAMRVFKKRLKMKRLDDESRVGRSPLTGGSNSTIVAIQPPNQYPLAVWEELVRQGRLKNAGRGLYQMA